MIPSVASTGGLEQPVANGNAEPLVFRQWANNDGGPGCIQFPQSGKQAAGKLLLIRPDLPSDKSGMGAQCSHRWAT